MWRRRRRREPRTTSIGRPTGGLRTPFYTPRAFVKRRTGHRFSQRRLASLARFSCPRSLAPNPPLSHLVHRRQLLPLSSSPAHASLLCFCCSKPSCCPRRERSRSFRPCPLAPFLTRTRVPPSRLHDFTPFALRTPTSRPRLHHRLSPLTAGAFNCVHPCLSSDTAVSERHRLSLCGL